MILRKWYVRSGQLERIVMAYDNVSLVDVCKEAIKRCNNEEIDECFWLDERGFRGPTLANKKEPELKPSRMVDTSLVIGNYK